MVSSMLNTGLAGLQTYVDAMSEVVGESTDPESAESFAHLLTKVAQVAGELRKAEKLELDALKKLTPAEIFVWAKQQTPELRARLVRDITALDAVERKSVLG